MVRIWDKVIGGSYQKVLPLVGILILTKSQAHIMSLYKVSDIQMALLKVGFKTKIPCANVLSISFRISPYLRNRLN